ncbi:MAG: Asp-tRNA(Asn)/Glu-tRNA(Gln) amidotransferase subunit GatC [Verrucomicrobia bacterium]|nr:Asp-tRNA(Asn)/Glu-tRNA(Gln) amidotransferase subunit GatC [Verrucomicrobiota bacterium]MDA1065426.1 Asp-tRNA(Asn)/Glu-tRNA(Gln) amidotransferase subunit GatC [Verrucomicrobiota bacterium]
MSEKGSIDIDYVANLARIELSDKERQRFSAQLGSILDYFEQLNAVDVSDVEPMAHAFQVENVLREDISVEGFDPETAVQHAAAKRNNMVQVPKVIDG